MSIYTALTENGHTPPTNLEHHTRETRIVLADTADGEDPIAGLSYTCDFRHEEESGATTLAAAFRNTAHPNSFLSQFATHPTRHTQADLIHEDSAHVAFATTVPTTDYRARLLARHFTDAITYLNDANPTAQGADSYATLTWHRNADLHAKITELGGTAPANATKHDLVTIMQGLQTPTRPDRHAAWFHFGDLLVVRRDDTAHGLVIDKLVAAARAGTLMIGGIGNTVFGTGLTLFDSRDIGPRTREGIVEDYLLREQWMEELTPVAQHLKKAGHDWFFLGKPSMLPQEGTGTPQVHYWLNGRSIGTPNGHWGQPCGWYTLDELRAEKFIADLEAREDRKAKA